MATYRMDDADVAAVYYRTGRSPSTSRLRQAPYYLVTFDDGTSGLMPIPEPSPYNLDVTYTAADLEVDRIEVYEGDPMEFVKLGFY